MRIGVAYGYVSSNLGDLAINRGTINLLRSVFPGQQYHFVFLNLTETALPAALGSIGDLDGVTYAAALPSAPASRGAQSKLARYLSAPPRFLADARLDDCDLVIYNAGEHLFSYQDSFRADLLWRLLPGMAALAKGIPFATCAATIGPFQEASSRALVQRYFALNDAVSVRDAGSVQEMARLGPQHTVPLLLDPAFFVRDQGLREGPPVVPRLGLVMRLEDFGLRVGPEQSATNLREHRQDGFARSRSLQTALLAIRTFLDRHPRGEVRVFSQVASDLELAQAIHAAAVAEGLGERVTLCQPTDIDDYLRLLSDLSLVVASRFHACILASAIGVPTFGTYFSSHGHKMPGLFEAFGRPQDCVEVTHPDTDRGFVAALGEFFPRAEEAGRLTTAWMLAQKQQMQQWLQRVASGPRRPVDRTQWSELRRQCLTHFEKSLPAGGGIRSACFRTAVRLKLRLSQMPGESLRQFMRQRLRAWLKAS